VSKDEEIKKKAGTKVFLYKVNYKQYAQENILRFLRQHFYFVPTSLFPFITGLGSRFIRPQEQVYSSCRGNQRLTSSPIGF